MGGGGKIPIREETARKMTKSRKIHGEKPVEPVTFDNPSTPEKIAVRHERHDGNIIQDLKRKIKKNVQKEGGALKIFEQNKPPAKSMEKMPEKSIGWDRIKKSEVIIAKGARPNQEKSEYTPLGKSEYTPLREKQFNRNFKGQNSPRDKRANN